MIDHMGGNSNWFLIGKLGLNPWGLQELWGLWGSGEILHYHARRRHANRGQQSRLWSILAETDLAESAEVFVDIFDVYLQDTVELMDNVPGMDRKVVV